MLQNREKSQSTYSIISFRVEHPGTNFKMLQILVPVLHQEPETTEPCTVDQIISACINFKTQENPNVIRV